MYIAFIKIFFFKLHTIFSIKIINYKQSQELKSFNAAFYNRFFCFIAKNIFRSFILNKVKKYNDLKVHKERCFSYTCTFCVTGPSNIKNYYKKLIYLCTKLQPVPRKEFGSADCVERGR